MTDSRILPGARARLVDDKGVTTREFYDFFRRLEQAGAAEADIEELARKLGSPDGTIANIPPITSQQLSAQFPIVVNGTSISLDQMAPLLTGDLRGVVLDSWGRVTDSRPVVSGAGVTIDGTTDPNQISISTSGLTNPMTTLGDVIKGGASGVPERLGIGSNGEVLTVVSGAPAWAAGGGGGDWTSFAAPFCGAWVVAAGSTSPTLFGTQNFTNQSLGAAGSLTFTNIATATPRIAYRITAAAVNGVAGLRGASLAFARDYKFKVSFVVSPFSGTSNASHRAFHGMYGTNAAPTDVNPSTLLNLFGFGYDAADTEWQFMVNDGSGTATKTALGASFPKPAADEATLFLITVEGTSTGVSATITNQATLATSTQTATTNIPSGTTPLMFWSYASTGGVSALIGVSYSRVFWSSGIP